MKKYIYLLIAPTLLSLASCGNSLPKRKGGQFCNVSFSSEVIKSDCPTFAPMDQNLNIHLDVPYIISPDTTWASEPTALEEGKLAIPNVEYTVNVDNIHVFIAGKEYPDSFTFYQQSNGYNVLTIRKGYVVNDIDIQVTTQARSVLYLFGYELGEELDNRRVDNEKTDDPKYTHDLVVKFSRPYQNEKKPIKTLDGQPAYPVFEHDAIDVTFTLIDKGDDQEPLPDDLRYRCNARYTLEGEDYTRKYDKLFYSTKIDDYGYRECSFHVPYKIVNDHGSFRQFGTE